MRIRELKWPKVSKMAGRESTITGSICNAIMPNFNPSDDDIDKVLSTLGQQNEKVLKCAYCGDKASEWDHFIAVTNKKEPSGYITEINNLIPSCGKCNQSRGNKDPIAWMSGDARHCPKTRRVKNIEEKIEFIKRFENKHKKKRVFVNPSYYKNTLEWKKLQKIQKDILLLLRAADDNIKSLRTKLTDKLKSREQMGDPKKGSPMPAG